MRRTLMLLVAVVVLGFIAYFATTTGASTEVADERAFGYADVEAIDRIYLADREGHTAELRRGGPTGWRYGEYPANRNAMKNLLQAVAQLEVRSLPAYAAVPNLIRTLAGGGILVQLFDANGNKLRGYYIGAGTNDELGTAASMEGSDNPYIVHIPTWSGNVRHRFNLRGDEWRSKQLFSAEPDRVELLSIAYPHQQSKGFRLERAPDGTYTVAPLTAGVGPERAVASGIAEGILSRYESYFISRYQNENREDLVADQSRQPFAIIRLRETGRPEQEVKLYPRFRYPDSSDETLSAYSAFINDGADYALLAVETTQPLLIGYEAF